MSLIVFLLQKLLPAINFGKGCITLSLNILFVQDYPQAPGTTAMYCPIKRLNKT